MTLALSGSCFRFFVLAAILLPCTVLGQSKNSPPAEALGWGSVWQQPANEQQRQNREIVQHYLAAMKAHRYPAALEICNQIIQKQPKQPQWYFLRALAFESLKQFDRAMQDLHRTQTFAQQQNPSTPLLGLLYVRARIHQKMGHYTDAVADLQTVLKADPRSVPALNSLAWLRATSPDAAFRNGREAVSLARQAVALKHDGAGSVVDTLAAAYAEAGDYSQAVGSEQRALAIVSKEVEEKEIKDPDRLKKLQQGATERLHLFEQHQPYHAPLDAG